jgi:hypothetical protein
MLMVVAVIIVLIETWWPPAIVNPPITPKTIGVEITSPKWGAKIEPPVTLTGTTKRALGDSVQLWLFNVGGTAYSPHGDRIIVSKRKEWTVVYKPKNYNDNDKRDLQLFLVGRDGQVLIETYKRINKHFAEANDLPYEGLLKLTADTVPACPPFQIFLSKPK